MFDREVEGGGGHTQQTPGSFQADDIQDSNGEITENVLSNGTG